jgi:DNA phosphorothioation-dependent restriction protein DptG
MIYELESASLAVAGSRVYGSVLVKVNTPLLALVADEVLIDKVVLDELAFLEVALAEELQLLIKLAKINRNANIEYIIFFKAILPFLS